MDMKVSEIGNASGALHGLDHPIWQALSTLHAPLAEQNTIAKRYPAALTRLAAVRDVSAESFAALARLMTSPQDTVALFLDASPSLPAGWKTIADGPLVQMVCTAPEKAPASRDSDEIEVLGSNDVDEMVELTTLTRPGPFGRRTYELGGYLGIRRNGRLVAMAGMRLHLPGFTEISAVCTHPDHRGHGYAGALVAAVAREILQRGETPFLHTRKENDQAIRVYRKLGFEVRREFELAVLQREETGDHRP